MRDPVIGYDGVEINVGDRVELHPAHDLWMMGARYGTVVGFHATPDDRIIVILDKAKGRRSGAADQFRRID